MTHLDPDLVRLGDALRATTTIDLAREERAERSSGAPSRARRTRLFRHPHLLAGSSLGLAGVGAVLVLVLGAGGAAAPPAFAITRSNDGSVTVQINQTSSIVTANNKLAAMGIHEQFGIDMASGPAPVSGAVKCQPKPGQSVSGPTVKVLVGKDGTTVIRPGTTGGNTGVGTFHLAACYVSNGTGYTGGSGNSGV